MVIFWNRSSGSSSPVVVCKMRTSFCGNGRDDVLRPVGLRFVSVGFLTVAGAVCSAVVPTDVAMIPATESGMEWCFSVFDDEDIFLKYGENSKARRCGVSMLSDRLNDIEELTQAGEGGYGTDRTTLIYTTGMLGTRRNVLTSTMLRPVNQSFVSYLRRS